MTNDNNKTSIILIVVVGLLALAAIVISAVALSRNGSSPTVSVNSGSGGGTPQTIYIQPPAANSGAPMGRKGRIYSIAIGHDYGSHEYFDEKGYLTGFGIGFIDLVCSEAGIDCRVVWDRYVNCWDSSAGQHARGGQGLHDRWYDACTGWYTTVERTHVFQFTQAYLKKQDSFFFVRKGASFDSNNKDNIKNSVIIFLDGWASDEKCLAREKDAIKATPTIVYMKTPEEAVQNLKANQTYKAIFTTDHTLKGRVDSGELDRAGGAVSCMLDGNAMMSRKDSDFPDQFNRGFNKVKNNGRFKKYCEESNKKHMKRGVVDCINTY